MEQLEYRLIKEKVYFFTIVVDTMLDATLYVASALCPQQD